MVYTWGRGEAVELKDILAGKTPEEQTEWLRTHMRNWGEFIQGTVQTRQQLAEWRSAGNYDFPPTWISVEEYRRLRGLPAKSR
jgi:hypothetical protein